MMINWNTIDTVLLDMDGTLLDLHYDNYFWATHLPKRYAELKGIAVHTAQQQLGKQIQSLQGTLNWYCLDYWADTLAVDIGLLKHEVKQKIKERPHSIAFLQFLKAQQKTVVLATNSHTIGLNIKLEQTAIGEYLDHIITSHQFRYPKEEQDFWQHLEAYLTTQGDFDPARTLFIDDNLSILHAAKTYGIGHTLGIHQPDSQTPRLLEHTPAIHHFNEIMPE